MNDFAEEIVGLLSGDKVDFNEFRKLSRRKGGFRSHAIRRLVWPTLLGVRQLDAHSSFKTYIKLNHRDVQQIHSDIERSLWKQDVCATWSDDERKRQRRRLNNLINAVISKNPSLHYYQGFHDIVSVFFLVIENDALTYSCVEALALDFIFDNMRENFDSVMELMKLVFVIIEEVDKELYRFLKSCNAEPFFSLSWILTWFSHEISNVDEIARLFDAILCSHSAYILYLCSSFTMFHGRKLMSEERDFGSVQNFYVKSAAQERFPIEEIIEDADIIYSCLPIEELVKKISPQTAALIRSEKILMLRDMIPWVQPETGIVATATEADGISTNGNCSKEPMKATITETPPKKKHRGKAERQLEISKDKYLNKADHVVEDSRKDVINWRSLELTELSRRKKTIFGNSKTGLLLYRKFKRKMRPYLSFMEDLTEKYDPRRPGVFPALLFNQILFAPQKKIYISLFSIAVIGGFLGYSLGGYMNR